MSLKLYYDPYDITCFRGEPTTNLFVDRYPYNNGGFSFPFTSSYRGIWTPNGIQTASIQRYNNPGNVDCCPAFFTYGSVNLTPSTTSRCPGQKRRTKLAAWPRRQTQR